MITATIQKTIKSFKILRHIKIWMMSMAFTFLPMFAAAYTLGEEPNIGIINWFTSPLKSITNLVIYILYFVITFILGKLVNLSASFMEWSLKLTMTSPEGIINVGWGVSLGLANNLFILILLAIAIGTILGLPQINKKLLPMFLIIALLINFSMVIGNIVIDSSNVFASSFLNSIQKDGGAIGDQLMNSMQAGEVLKQLNSVITADYGVILLKSIYVIFIQLVIIITFLFGGIYLLSRTFWLWLLLMLAPLAWIAKLIPKAEHYWDEWWSTFLAKAFFAPVYLFMVYLAVTISKKSGSALSGVLSKEGGGISAGVVIQMLTVAFLMMAGIHYGQKAGGSFANGVINYGKNVAGRYKKTLGALRTPSGIEKLLKKVTPEKLGEGTASLLARTGIAGRKIGYGPQTIAKLEKQRMAERSKMIAEESARFEGMTTSEIIARLKKEGTLKGTGTTSVETAALIKQLQSRPKEEKGEFSELEISYMRQAMGAALKSTASTGINVMYFSPIPSKSGQQQTPKTTEKESNLGYSEQQKAMGLSRFGDQ